MRTVLLRLLMAVPFLSAGCALLPGAREERDTAMSTKQPPCPLKHGQWAPLPEMTDEFDGTALDPAKWHPNNPGWLGRQPGFFLPANVTVSEGKLHITMKHEEPPNLPKGYHTYTCGAVKSKATVRYGYFEARCRAMKSRGSSAFWFYEGTPEVWTEIDVFEIGGGAPGHEKADHMNAHVFHTLANPDRHWSTGGKWQAPSPLADEFRIYGLEWDREKLRYYVDGIVVREMANTHWHQPLTLNFDSETMPDWFGLPDVATLPSTFSIDYIRAWKRLDGPPDDLPKACTFLFPGERAKAAENQTLTWRLKTSDGGAVLVVARLGPDAKPQHVHLEYEDDAFYAAQTADRAHKTLSIKDRKGRALSLAFTWLKAKDEKKHNGYRADDLVIAPAATPSRSGSETHELVAEDGEPILMKLQY